MGMLDQMLANLYKPSKQEKPMPLSAKVPVSAGKTIPTPQLAQTTVSQGQFLRGEVLDLRANQILVLLENGATVSARTEGTLNLSIGENARFFVAQTTEDQILLKLAKEENEAENPMIDKALTAAGITKTEKSVSIVTELLSHSQPVTESNIRHYLSLSTRYPELPVKDFILMELHQIPVNADTVTQFASYHDGNGKLLTQAASLLEELNTQLDKLPEGELKQQFRQELTQFIIGSSETITSAPSSMQETMLQTQNNGILSTDTATSGNSLPNAGNVPYGDFPSATEAPQNQEPSDSLQPAGDSIPNTVPESIMHNHADKAPVLTSPEPAPLFQDFLDSFLLTPEEVADAEKVKEYYEELQQKLETLEQFANKLADTTKDTATNAPKQMRGNLSFMESVNQVFPFLQLPLKFKETPAHGELYVYERKKAVKQGDTISALLHLELDALGTLDVFVTMAGQNVTTRFSSSDKESGDLIRSELASLKEALSAKGYSLQAEVTVREPETDENTPTLLEQFLEEHAPGGLERYTFDIRA